MITFYNYAIIKKINYVKLTADFCVEFEDINHEDYFLGTPECWDRSFLEKVDIEKFNLYFICSNTVAMNSYNKVTDWKKVWGLNDIPIGIYDNAYINESGKVYFGIVEDKASNHFGDPTSSTLLLLPQNVSILPDMIFEFFKENHFDFNNEKDNCLLFQLQSLIPSSILLRYFVGENASVSIYGNNVESIFSEENVEQWRKEFTFPVLRKS